MSITKDVTTDEKWREEVLESPGGLKVVEVYQDWCGPAKSLEATFKRFYFDNSTKAIGFITASSRGIKDLAKYADVCEPVFQFYIKGKKEAEVTGCDLPKLMNTLNEMAARPEVAG